VDVFIKRKLLEGFLKHQSAQNPIGKKQLRRVGGSTGARTHSLRSRRLYNMNEHDKITDQGMHSISVMKCISLNLTIGIPMDSYGGKRNVFFLRYSLISKQARRFARIWVHNTPYYHNPYLLKITRSDKYISQKMFLGL
jgi:hypothetical protein